MTPEELAALEEDIERLCLHKSLIADARQKVWAEYEVLNKEYNRVRHMLANRVARLRKEKAK